VGTFHKDTNIFYIQQFRKQLRDALRTDECLVVTIFARYNAVALACWLAESGRKKYRPAWAARAAKLKALFAELDKAEQVSSTDGASCITG
jgi:hypothetical protein